jgi:hypothetical protein
MLLTSSGRISLFNLCDSARHSKWKPSCSKNEHMPSKYSPWATLFREDFPEDGRTNGSGSRHTESAGESWVSEGEM